MRRERRHNKVGNLSRKVDFYTPTYQRTTTGGQLPKWVIWKTGLFAEVMPDGGSEEDIADKRTAVRKRRFRLRSLSIPGINETMVLRIDGDDYEIKQVDFDNSELRTHYKIIRTERLADNISPVTVLDSSLAMDFAQTFSDISATSVLVTAGTIPVGAAAENYHQLLYVFRSGARMTYNEGFTLSGNTITFTQKLRNENILVHQYQTAGS